MPGAGKSFLSCSIVSYLYEHHNPGVQSSFQASIGYFFFKDNDPETRSVHHALRDVAYQICLNDPVYARHVTRVCETPDDIKTIESAWRKLFLQFFVESDERGRSVYIILDGIDEAFESDRIRLFSILQDLRPDAKGNLRINMILAGRPHLSDALFDALETDKLPWIPVDANKNSEDIASYIESSIRKSRLLRRVSKGLQQEILVTLTTEANGMFLWVDLMIRTLNTKPNERAILEAMRTAPRGLREMFHHVLEGLSESISEDDAEQLNEIFAWVAFATRPLTLQELDGAIRYTSGDGLLLLERKLRKDWASFFTLHRADGQSTSELEALTQSASSNLEDAIEASDNNDISASFEVELESEAFSTTVAFSHASIGDFFRDTQNGKVGLTDKPAIGVDADSAKAHVLKPVFQILVDDDAPSKGEPVMALRNYAKNNWAGHLQWAEIKASRGHKAELGKLLLKFCRDEATIEFWISPRGAEIWRNDYIENFRKCLEDPDVFTSQSTSDQDWIRSTKVTPVETFHAMVQLVARKWLQDQYWIPSICFQIILGYLRLRKGEPFPEEARVDDPRTIEDTAEWAGFERDALWHRRLAITLRENGFLNAAQAHFEHALELDPTMLIALAGLAMACERRNEMEKALELRCNLVQQMRSELKCATEVKLEVRRQVAFYIKMAGDTCDALGKSEEAYQAMLECWKFDPSFFGSLEYAFFHLSRMDRHEELMAILHEMQKQKEPNNMPNQLVAWLDMICQPPSDLFDICRCAARATATCGF
jgi:tetratricopeptide (TPR) repeat protein